MHTVHSINEYTPSKNLTNSAITLYLDDMLAFFGDIMIPTSLLDQLPKNNVKIIQQNNIFLSK